MPGYPYYYGDEDMKQEEKFIIFSLKKISKNPILASAPLVFVDTPPLEFSDAFSYHFCNEISQVCGTFRSIPETGTIVLDYDGFCRFVCESDTILNAISSNMEITRDSAMQQAQNFFANKNVIVQAEGIQGAVYKAGSYLQSAGSAGLVVNTLGLAKIAGVTGLEILKAQPLLVIAIPTTGAIFFYGCGAIVGSNVVGKICITTGDVLSIPMKGIEIMWNTYGNTAVQKVFGIPLILNMTQTFKSGPGYTIDEVVRYISPLDKKSIFKILKTRVKELIAKW